MDVEEEEVAGNSNITTTTTNTPHNKTKDDKSKHLKYSNCVYTSCYCEENVWQLCKQIQKDNPTQLSECYVVFISNKNRQVPLWMQKSAKDPLTPVVWDYHVILVQKPAQGKPSEPSQGKPLVYDLDSLLAFPCLLEDYIHQAIQSENSMKKQYHRRFRVVEAAMFLETFASDRSHMRLPNGQYQKPPPDYPAIRTPTEEMNLDQFIDMSPGFHGRVKDLKGLIAMFLLP